MEKPDIPSITVLLPAGRLPLELMTESQKIAEEFGCDMYFSTAQNLRIIDFPPEAEEQIRERLARLGAQFKAPGKFPIPRVCIGKGYCKLGVSDPKALSEKILARFADRENTKAKFKIAISACTMCCSGAKTTDIGIMATRDGYDLFAGGKGGPFPRVGVRIARGADDEQVLEMVQQLVDFHDLKTEKKQRIVKLLKEADFPFSEV